MTEEQVHEAIEQVLVDCELRQAEYLPTGMRESLYRLGYNTEDADQVIRFVAKGGFTYCLDPMISATHYNGGEMVTDYPDADVCYWGPDQLASRLWSLSNYRPKSRYNS